MSDFDWQDIGTIQPGANWQSTAETSANVFRFLHHNPPARGLLQVAQTDGAVWLFEPRTISSDRDAQILLLDNAIAFGGSRRICLRYANPASSYPNWSVTVSAVTLELTPMPLDPDFQLLGQISSEVNALATQQTQIITQLGTIAQVLASFPTPTPTPTPTPPPAPSVPSASGHSYTASQSGNYGGVIGTYANLTDGDGSTGAQTGGEMPAFIRASYSEPVIVTAIQVGGGVIPAAGTISPNLNGAKVQYSTDAVNWATVWEVTGVTDSGANQFPTYTLPSPITAQYWQLAEKQYVATTQLKLM